MIHYPPLNSQYRENGHFYPRNDYESCSFYTPQKAKLVQTLRPQRLGSFR
ncbi:hypothetical protein E2C01_031729 [Portunus trituberculatus]|uniref:Uncharacterized protein n=1 Tax=Portunus trituberculatus TaxID=210409 RepID=A0A5B7F0V3_PORTR|nr:hypothetical protein [Portunus trituberculatus]